MNFSTFLSVNTQHMKQILTILACIICQTSFGQFAIVADEDGFVNIRSSAEVADNIIDTLENGQVVYCFEAEGGWLPVDYDLSRQNKNGYIHKTRVKFIEDFEKVAYSSLTDSSIVFKIDSIRLTINQVSFNPKSNNLQFHKANTANNEAGYLEKVNGKEIWGTDGNVPRKQYGQMLLRIGKDKIYLPVDNLFEPNLDYTSLNIDSKNSRIYIAASNSDGAGAYAVLWIIENGKFKERIITIPF